MPKPNILHITMDDMRDDFLRFMPNTRAWIGRYGRTYTNARVQSAVCPTSRFSALTGLAHMYTNATSVPAGLGDPVFPTWTYQTIPDGNTGGASAESHSNCVGRWLQDVGYRTAMLGKYMNFSVARAPIPQGYHWWREAVSDDAYRRLGFDIQDEVGAVTSPTDPLSKYLCDQAQSFITASAAMGKPWYCYLATPDPHTPFNAAPEDQFKFDHYDHPLNFQASAPGGYGGMPSWISATPTPTPEAKANYRDIARFQAKEVFEFDRRLGILFAYLDSSGQTPNTYIFLSSDNGMVYGEHGVNAGGIAKNDFFGVSNRVPLIARGPGIVRGRSSTPMLCAADITQTIVEASGCTPGRPQFPHRMSLIGHETVDRHILMTRGASTAGSFISPCPYGGEAVVSSTHMLARYRRSETAAAWGAPGPYAVTPIATNTLEMYDYINDPNEWVNLGNSVSAPMVTIRNTLLTKLNAMVAP